uniref:Uncharacterized protein n=1 Tax=Meloidogyne enterolobii TaxID=390850 RepID=A0A6V7X921_MELEN|nr:unnamed protein product [Meloidogyne enterolobii]
MVLSFQKIYLQHQSCKILSIFQPSFSNKFKGKGQLSRINKNVCKN